MKKNNPVQIILISISVCIMLNNYSSAQGLPYLGQDMPGMQPVRFAPAIFTEELHAPPIFSPDGQEVYWSLMDLNPGDILFMKLVNGIWTDPAIAPFSSNEGSDSPFISSDGTKLVFLSRQNAAQGENIWVVEKNNGEWGTPSMLGNEVNQFEPHWQASIADNHNLYFGGGADIYFSEFVNGNYTTAQRLDSAINTDDGLETTPFIASDESYLIFARVHGSSLYSNLFISSKNNDGSWSEAVKMFGLSSIYHELYPNISPDGRFMMFLSLRSGLLLPYWVDAQVIYNYITDVDDEQKTESPGSFQLYQNYPNPFNPITKIKYQIPKLSFVTLKVYDVLGNEIETLVNEQKPPGSYEINFNSSELTSGVYFYKLQANEFISTKKMVLLK
ncbi:T9SS type A sorting domain-containing protein [Bacteroidota bacterium]